MRGGGERDDRTENSHTQTHKTTRIKRREWRRRSSRGRHRGIITRGACGVDVFLTQKSNWSISPRSRRSRSSAASSRASAQASSPARSGRVGSGRVGFGRLLHTRVRFEEEDTTPPPDAARFHRFRPVVGDARSHRAPDTARAPTAPSARRRASPSSDYSACAMTSVSRHTLPSLDRAPSRPRRPRPHPSLVAAVRVGGGPPTITGRPLDACGRPRVGVGLCVARAVHHDRWRHHGQGRLG